MARRRREPERSLLDVREHRKRSRNEASRDGSAARTIELSIRGPLASTCIEDRSCLNSDNIQKYIFPERSEVEGQDCGERRRAVSRDLVDLARCRGSSDRPVVHRPSGDLSRSSFEGSTALISLAVCLWRRDSRYLYRTTCRCHGSIHMYRSGH